MHFLGYFALLTVTIAGSLVAQDQVPAQEDIAPVVQTPAGYKVDFDNQDIKVVLSALAQAAGVNVTFSDLPEIRTTLRLGQPVPKEQLVSMMRQVAEGNGLVMRQRGTLIHISEPGDAEEEPEADMGPPPDLRIYTYRMKYNTATEVAPILTNLFTGVGAPRARPNSNRQQRERLQRRYQRRIAESKSYIRVVADEYTNTLLVRATPEEWKDIKKIIARID